MMEKNDTERSLRAWTKSDQRIIEGSLDSDLFELSSMVGRDAFSVARRIATTVCEMQDEAIEYGLSFQKGTEPESEFLGLVLGGIPISTAISWACGKEDRLPEDLILGMISDKDYRLALRYAAKRGIWLETGANLNDVQALLDLPEEIVFEAIAASIDGLGSLAPADILAIAEGELSPDVFRLARYGRRLQSCTGARFEGAKKRRPRSSRRNASKPSWVGGTTVIKAKRKSRYSR